MYISTKDWKNYIDRLSALDKKAGELMQEWIRRHGFSDTKAMTDYAYALAQKYGEGSAALSAEMYDAVAEMQGKLYAPAEATPPPDYGEVAKTVNGILKHSQNPNSIASGVSRLVKRTGADTTLKNALRDGAQFAWVPNGDTCAFCITLASRGWQYMSKKALKNGHAEHIHANCDCTYSIRFDGKGGVKGYDPQKYADMYYGAEGNTPNEKINSLRRMHYEQNKDVINAQKRELYRKVGNSGAFASLSEKMSRKHIRDVAKEFNISLEHVIIIIDKDEEKLKESFLFSGRADYLQLGRIDFFPKAFQSKEELVRTIFHEHLHVMQFREYGSEFVQNHRAYFERITENAEEEFIFKAKEAGLL